MMIMDIPPHGVIIKNRGRIVKKERIVGTCKEKIGRKDYGRHCRAAVRMTYRPDAREPESIHGFRNNREIIQSVIPGVFDIPGQIYAHILYCHSGAGRIFPPEIGWKYEV